MSADPEARPEADISTPFGERPVSSRLRNRGVPHAPTPAVSLAPARVTAAPRTASAARGLAARTVAAADRDRLRNDSRQERRPRGAAVFSFERVRGVTQRAARSPLTRDCARTVRHSFDEFGRFGCSRGPPHCRVCRRSGGLELHRNVTEDAHGRSRRCGHGGMARGTR